MQDDQHLQDDQRTEKLKQYYQQQHYQHDGGWEQYQERHDGDWEQYKDEYYQHDGLQDDQHLQDDQRTEKLNQYYQQQHYQHDGGWEQYQERHAWEQYQEQYQDEYWQHDGQDEYYQQYQDECYLQDDLQDDQHLQDDQRLDPEAPGRRIFRISGCSGGSWWSLDDGLDSDRSSCTEKPKDLFLMPGEIVPMIVDDDNCLRFANPRQPIQKPFP